MRIILILLFVVTSSFSQTFSISGTILDSAKRTPLSGANVFLKNASGGNESVRISDSKGRFIFETVSIGEFLIKISFVGYNNFEKRIAIAGKSVELDKLYLSMIPIKLKEIEVSEKAPLVIQNNDTTEFIADGVKVNKNATADELISKLPGVTVQDGKVQAHGEDVKKVLVDGKPFFGDDPNAVIKNIPAEIIEKIQVFDQQSEQSQFTGFDDGNTNKTLNIITRTRIREGTFGRLHAGYGNDQRFMANGNINFFNNERRISLLGQTNNTNEQNFSQEDLLGVMAQGSSRRNNFQRGQGGMGGMGRGGGGGQGGGGRDASDFMVDSKDGLTKTYATGLNYIDKWGESLELSGSYFFNYTDNNSLNESKRQYLLTATEQEYIESGSAATKNINHRFNLRMTYQIDSMNSILFIPRFTLQNNDGASYTGGITSINKMKVNSIDNFFNSNLNALDASAQLLYRKRFETKGRTLSVRASSSYRTKDGENDQYTENIFFDKPSLSDTLDQNSILDKKGKNSSANLTFTEPFGEYSIIQINASYSYSNDDSDQKTYRLLTNNVTILDTVLSNIYDKTYNVQNYGIGYMFRQDEFLVNLGLSYNVSSLKNLQTFPKSVETQKIFNSYLPSLMIRYNISRGQNFIFNYRASNNDPSVEQLQNVLDYSNPLQLSIGNPQLLQDYRHSLSLRYSNANAENLQSFFLLMNGTITNDHITNNTIIAGLDTLTFNGIILNPGTQLRTPVNLDGYYNLRSFISYGFPFTLIKCNLNFNVNGGYSRTPGMTNGLVSISNISNYGVGMSVNSNITEKLDFSISTNRTYSLSVNSTRETRNESFDQRTRIRLHWEIFNTLILKTNFEHRYQSNITGGFDPNSYLWNMSLGLKLFSGDEGELRFTAYDILKMNNNTRRNTRELYIEDQTTNILGQYFMLSFLYNIKAY